MPIVGSTGTPSAADAVFPGTTFVGQVVADSVVSETYVPEIATALDVPYKLQNEIMAIEQYLLSGGFAQIQRNNFVIGYALSTGLFNWQALH